MQGIRSLARADYIIGLKSKVFLHDLCEFGILV